MKLSNIKEWGSKPRTMLRFIKCGDIFVFKLYEGNFGFGRVLAKVDLGHVVEVFDKVLKSPSVTTELIEQARRLGSPIILDSYSLFDRRLEGDWQIIAHHDGFRMSDTDNVSFVYGHPNAWKKIDVLGNESAISDSEASLLPSYSPTRDASVRSLFISDHP